MLQGKGYFNDRDYPGAGRLNYPAWKDYLAKTDSMFGRVPGALPSHREYLDSLRTG